VGASGLLTEALLAIVPMRRDIQMEPIKDDVEYDVLGDGRSAANH
jgi:hypothetical protein